MFLIQDYTWFVVSPSAGPDVAANEKLENVSTLRVDP